MSACKYCGEEIDWRKDGAKNTPVNLDGSLHKPTCKGSSNSAPVRPAGAIVGLLTGYNSGSATFRVKGGATKTYALHNETFKAWQTAGYGPDHWIEFTVDAQGFIQSGARNVQMPDWGPDLKDPTGGEIKTPEPKKSAELPKETPCTSPQAAPANPAPVERKKGPVEEGRLPTQDELLAMVYNYDTYWKAKTILDVMAREDIRQQVIVKNWQEAVNSAIAACPGAKPEQIFEAAEKIHDFVAGKAAGVQ